MEKKNIIIQKLWTRDGFLLYNPLTGAVGNPIYLPESESSSVWEEIPDPDYVPTQSGTYIDPITYVIGMTVTNGLWYTDGNDIWECIADGMPTDFNDKEYFDIIDTL